MMQKHTYWFRKLGLWSVQTVREEKKKSNFVSVPSTCIVLICTKVFFAACLVTLLPSSELQPSYP